MRRDLEEIDEAISIVGARRWHAMMQIQQLQRTVEDDKIAEDDLHAERTRLVLSLAGLARAQEAEEGLESGEGIVRSDHVGLTRSGGKE
jgi:hypothetical protein